MTDLPRSGQPAGKIRSPHHACDVTYARFVRGLRVSCVDEPRYARGHEHNPVKDIGVPIRCLEDHDVPDPDRLPGSHADPIPHPDRRLHRRSGADDPGSLDSPSLVADQPPSLMCGKFHRCC
jgi:hypothetical protein